MPDALNPANWTDTVHYDAQVGSFVTFEFDGDDIHEVDVFDDAIMHTYDRDEFVDEVESGSFSKVDETVVDDPVRVLTDVIDDVAVRPNGTRVAYDGVEVSYARKACDIVLADDA